MNKYEKILKEYLDKDLTRVSEKYRKTLTDEQFESLNELLKLQYSAKSIRINDKVGKNVLSRIIAELSQQEVVYVPDKRRFYMSSFRYGLATVFTVAIFSFVWLNLGSRQMDYSVLEPESRKVIAEINNQSVSDVNGEDAVLASTGIDNVASDEVFDLASKVEVTNEDF